MKKCKYCKSEIDDKAVVCPICRKRLRWWDSWILFPIFVFIGVAIVWYILENVLHIFG